MAQRVGGVNVTRSASPEEYSCGNMQAVGITAVEGKGAGHGNLPVVRTMLSGLLVWGGASPGGCSCGEVRAVGSVAVGKRKPWELQQ